MILGVQRKPMPTPRKKIAVIGDAMVDYYRHGKLHPSQDGCLKFIRSNSQTVLGGALNAANQLRHWDVEVFPICPIGIGFLASDTAENGRFNKDLLLDGYNFSKKERYLDEVGRIIFRIDNDSSS